MWHLRARTDEFCGGGERRGSVLNLDLLEQLNKQSQWQNGKITRKHKVAHRFQSYFSQQIPVFSTEKAEPVQKQKFPFRNYIPIKENTQISMVSPLETTRSQLQRGQPNGGYKDTKLVTPKRA